MAGDVTQEDRPAHALHKGEQAMTDARQHAHELIDSLPEMQLSALVGLLETIIDPITVALSHAPVDDEPVPEEEERAVKESREWLKHNPGIPFEQVVAELGFTMEEVKNYQDPA
jgi:hypothetical protein